MHKAKSHGEIPSLKNIDTTAQRSHLQPGEGHYPLEASSRGQTGKRSRRRSCMYGEIWRCAMNNAKPVRVYEVITLCRCRHVVFADEACHDEALSTRRHGLTGGLGLSVLARRRTRYAACDFHA